MKLYAEVIEIDSLRYYETSHNEATTTTTLSLWHSVVENGVETVTVKVDGVLTRRTINGVPQPTDKPDP